MKLGEILIEKGVIEASQLELALKSQLIFGGHLGTSLIEMGLLDEDTLGNVLSATAGVPYAPPHLFAHIPTSTINAVPAKIAEEYQVVPIKLEDRAVHLALVDPRDLRALDELKFAIGRTVVPWIAPEVRVFQALEKYYAVGRRSRYIKLDRRLDEAGQRPQLVEEDVELKFDAAPEATSLGEDFSSAASSDSEFGYGKSWQEVAEDLDGRGFPKPAQESARTPSRGERPDRPGRSDSSLSLAEVAERYCRADTRDDLARAVLDFGDGRAERMLLMIVRGNRACVWDQRGLALSDDTRSKVGFEVTSEPLFHLLEGNDHYHGALPARDEILSFYRALDVAPPMQLLLVPIHVNDLLIAIALVDGGPRGRIEGDVDEFLKAFRLFATAVGMVALRKKIRDTAQPIARAVGS